MIPVLEAAGSALSVVLSWPNVLYPVAGTLLAMVFAILPGVSGVTLLALAIPLTLSWEPIPILLFFGALVGGGTFMGSVTAILLNVPGTAPNAATMLDGHPLAQRGEAKTAIACSAAASALGSVVGVLMLIVLLPWIRQIILALGPPEMLMLAIWGLATLSAAVRGATMKGLAMAGLGLLVSFVGLDPRTAEARFTLGIPQLLDGVAAVPLFLGVFALAEVIDLAASNRLTVSGKTRLAELGGDVRAGVRSVFRHWALLVRSSFIGAVIGLVPGIGGTVASFVAYGHAVHSAGDGGRFGDGDIRGVIAPEAANDAKDGGSLVPTLAFGVPGSAGTALLLATLLIHGVTPGRELVTDGLELVFVLVWSLLLSNWLTSAVGLALAPQLARLTLIRTHSLVPLVLILAMFSAYAYRGRTSDVLVALAFGVLGFYMKRYGWPRVALVIAVVLGPLFEANLHLTRDLHRLGRIDFWTRPLAMALLIVTLVTLAAPWLRRRRAVSGGRR